MILLFKNNNEQTSAYTYCLILTFKTRGNFFLLIQLIFLPQKEHYRWYLLLAIFYKYLNCHIFISFCRSLPAIIRIVCLGLSETRLMNNKNILYTEPSIYNILVT